MRTMNKYLRSCVIAEIMPGTERFSRIRLYRVMRNAPEVRALYYIRAYLCPLGDKRISRLLQHYKHRYYYKKLVRDFGIYIGNNVSIGPGLKLPHPNGIIIGKGVKIGMNAVIYHQTTFGARRIGEGKQALYPTIGDNCVFYAGCKVLGPVRIADGTIIGANAVMLQDSKPGDVYVGIPAQKAVK